MARRLSQTKLTTEAAEFLLRRHADIDITASHRVNYTRKDARRVARALEFLDSTPGLPQTLREPLWRLHDEFEAWESGKGDRVPAGVWWLYRATPRSRWLCRGALYLGGVVNEAVLTSAARSLQEAHHTGEGMALVFAESSLKALGVAPEYGLGPFALGKPAQDALAALKAIDPDSSHGTKVALIKKTVVPYMPFGSGK
jgi:hypothetical protein